jgi:hypothetical protein
MSRRVLQEDSVPEVAVPALKQVQQSRQFWLGPGSTSNSAEAESFGGGSSTGFNNLASAGGAGAGSVEGSASGIFESGTLISSGNQAATATFSGNGSGTNGKVPNQPYIGGAVIGSGNGSGTAIVGGSFYTYIVLDNRFEGNTGDAAFKSTGGGSGFVDGVLGNADGSAPGGASGAASGTTQEAVTTYNPYTFLYGDSTSLCYFML